MLPSDRNKTDDLCFTSDIELKSFLDNLITTDYKKNISDWIYYAKPNEKKGLFILSKVIKHRGEKMFKTQLNKTKEEVNDVTKLTMEEAYKRYQKRKIVSSYSEFYGGNLDDKYKYNNILKYKDFENVFTLYLIKFS
jgi:hypothetical protein